MQGAVIGEQCRAIGANGFGISAHVDKDMRMIERRRRTHAHKFAGMDTDDRIDAWTIIA